jgi:hypothetical protein
VITAQTILLTDQQTAVNFEMQRMVAGIQLIKALIQAAAGICRVA